jgi:hypothetical protein
MRNVLTALLIAALVTGAAIPVRVSRATDYSSSHFIVKDPVVEFGSGFGTSSGFQLWGALGQPGIGFTTTTAFGLKSGFFYFLGIPAAPDGLSASTVSQTQINLSWTDRSGNESGFSIERKTGTGGTYAIIATTTVNVAAYSDSTLSAGTAYYYRLRSFNIDGFSSYSAEVNATTQSAPSPPGGGGGGGGGGTPPPSGTAVIFHGRAYPASYVTLLRDGQIAALTKAGPDAMFDITLSSISPGIYSFGVWAEDIKGYRSPTQTFITSVVSGATSVISGIFLAPTIATDKTEVQRGNVIDIFGYSAPLANVSVIVSSDEELLKKASADTAGAWLYKFDSYEVNYGDHSARSRSTFVSDISDFSKMVTFKVGTRDVYAQAPTKCPKRADLNADCKVNLVDFSIAAYWYKRALSAAFALIEKDRLNGDGLINLQDFSIMAYYWTG